MASPSQVRQTPQKKISLITSRQDCTRDSPFAVPMFHCQHCLHPKLQAWLKICRNLSPCAWHTGRERRFATQSLYPVLTTLLHFFGITFMPHFHLPLLKEGNESLLACPMAKCKCLGDFTSTQSSYIYFIYTSVEANRLWITK